MEIISPHSGIEIISARDVALELMFPYIDSPEEVPDPDDYKWTQEEMGILADAAFDIPIELIQITPSGFTEFAIMVPDAVKNDVVPFKFMPDRRYLKR